MLPAAATEADAVLIDGPPLTGRRRLLHPLLRSWTDEPMIVSTRHVEDRVRRVHEQATAEAGEDPVVIDCVSAAHADDLEESEQTRYAAGPGNLTNIGTRVTEVLESRRDEDLAVGITALSPLVTYTSVESVFQFTQVLINQAIGQGWSVAAVASSPIYEDPTHHALRNPFDAVIETRRADAVDADVEVDGDDDTTAGSAFRVRSREGVTDWLPVSSV